MKKHFFSRVLIVLFALLLPFTAVSNVSADPPVQSTFPIMYDGIIPTSCGFDLAIHEEGLFRVITFYDDGVMTGVHEIYGQLKVTYSGNGKTLNVIIKGPFHATFVEGNVTEIRYLGPTEYIVVPGYGPAGGLAGQIWWKWTEENGWVLKVVGNDHGIPPWDWGPICDYFR